MEELKNKKNVLWDFDGVILDSMDIRTSGFREVLRSYPDSQVEKLITYHKYNGGLSRYVKFKYFFEGIRKEKGCDGVIQQLATQYSQIMRKSLTFKDRLIDEVLNFIEKNHKTYQMHIVSGSDGEELNYLCEKLDLKKYFISIEGSPTPKIKLVADILRNNNYLEQETCLIGDSINDLEAAEKNAIDFFGYNNEDLKEEGFHYINKF